MSSIDRPFALSILGALALGAAITAGGIGIARSTGPDTASDTATQSSQPTPSGQATPSATPSAAAKTPPAKGTSAMSCKGSACSVTFFASDDKVLKPFGLSVELAKADPKGVDLVVEGKELSVKPGKTAKADGASVAIVGTPSAEGVTLLFRKG